MRRDDPTLGPNFNGHDAGVPVPGVAVTPFRFSGDTEGPPQANVSTSLRQMQRYLDAAEEQKARQAEGAEYSPRNAPVRISRPSPFDMWVEGRYSSFREDRSGLGLDGYFQLVYFGADYVLNPSFLVGALVQFDSMRLTSFQNATDTWGHGWMTGPYATVRLSDNVFLQGRAAWGRSTNEVRPYMTYVDQFDTNRWLVAATLAGQWKFGQWGFRPTASVTYLEDVAKSYTDSLGVVIPDVKSSLGQAKAGPSISYTFMQADGSVLEPRVGIDVIWNFVADNPTQGAAGQAPGPVGVRGSTEIGLRATTAKGIALDFSGTYDGIGAADFHAVTGKATVRIPLN
jgi:outer membrane autotransporter protein